MPKCKKRKIELELSEEDYKENISHLVAEYKKKQTLFVSWKQMETYCFHFRQLY